MKKESRAQIFWMLTNMAIGVILSLIQMFIPSDDLRNLIVMFTGEMDEPLNIFALLTIVLIGWRIGIIWSFAKLHRTSVWLKWPIIVVSPFNFGLPFVLIYMTISHWRIKSTPSQKPEEHLR